MFGLGVTRNEEEGERYKRMASFHLGPKDVDYSIPDHYEVMREAFIDAEQFEDSTPKLRIGGESDRWRWCHKNSDNV
jgi:hypothetical protein